MKRLFAFLCICIGSFPCVISASTSYGINDILAIGLPVLEVQTDYNEEPTCDYLYQSDGYPLSTIANATKVPGRLLLMAKSDTLYDSGAYIPDSTGITIKIRGNCSAFERKKSYKLKLQSKADLLCRSNIETDYRDKNWVLLRTDEMYPILNIMVGLKISEMMALPWTPAWCFVNVVINGDYRGVYVLAESVKRNPDCRLNVNKQTGFIAEYDPYYWNEDVYIESSIPSSLHYSLKFPDPENITEQQLSDVTSAIQEMEKSIFSNNTSKIDITSFVNWLMAHDILGTQDAHGSNIFLMKYDNTEQTKVQMCNLWDFDSITQTEGSWAKVHSPGLFLYYYLFRYENEEFMNVYMSKWEEVKNSLFSFLDEWLDNYATSDEANALDISLQLESKRYNRKINSVDTVISSLRQWFKQRKSWIESSLSPSSINCNLMKPRFENSYNLKGIINNYQHCKSGIVIRSNKKWQCR